MSAIIWRLSAVLLVMPVVALVYALWHDGVLVDRALMLWMSFVTVGAIVAGSWARSTRIKNAKLRSMFWSLLLVQVIALVVALASGELLSSSAPLWSVCVAQVALATGWALLAQRRKRPEARRT